MTHSPEIVLDAWSERRLKKADFDLFAARVSSSTTTMKKVAPEATLSTTAPDKQRPVMAWTGTFGYVVAWESFNSSTYTQDVHAARISN